jgi:hypothetical protein
VKSVRCSQVLELRGLRATGRSLGKAHCHCSQVRLDFVLVVCAPGFCMSRLPPRSCRVQAHDVTTVCKWFPLTAGRALQGKCLQITDWPGNPGLLHCCMPLLTFADNSTTRGPSDTATTPPTNRQLPNSTNAAHSTASASIPRVNQVPVETGCHSKHFR